MLTLKNVTASVNGVPILKGVSYIFEPGKTYAIMGPNGSGKSTLASVVMGHPAYIVSDTSEMLFNSEDISDLPTHERAQKGLFMSYQSPISLAGVSIYSLLRHALGGRLNPVETRAKVKKLAQSLAIKEELLSRSLNEDFSGGEKKKMEILQALVLQPSCMFFDEIDTGVDVDALKTIGKAIRTLQTPQTTCIVITHYTRLLDHVKPDVVLVIQDGVIVAEGDMTLAEHIEKKGYESITSHV